MFHCLRPAVDGGGRTILVDGFAVAERMRTESPELFAVLASKHVEYEYLESSNWHARAFSDPVIRQFAHVEKIAQIRSVSSYNRFDKFFARFFEKNHYILLTINFENFDLLYLEDRKSVV